jgi:hypothetical protein
MPCAREVSPEIVKKIRTGSVFFYCVYAGSAFSCRARGFAGGRLASDPAELFHAHA